LDLDDRLGSLQALLQPLILAAQSGDLSRLRVGLGATPLRGQDLQSTSTPLLTPFVQVRAVEPFPAQQGANLAPLRTRVSFTENAQLVFGGESAPLGFRNDFRIRRADYVGRLTAIATGLNGFIVCYELLSTPELYTKFSG